MPTTTWLWLLVVFALILFPSALWMPLAFEYLDAPNAGLWWMMRITLLVVGLAPLTLLALLLKLPSDGGARRPAAAGAAALPEADPVGAYPPPTGHVASSAPDNMPRADDMAARGGFPEMKLELHVYSNVPGERIVFINGHRYKAGDTTAEGASVEEITQDGVIMSMGGNRFLLPRD